MAIVASGQLTLTDLNDSKQLIMFIGSSQQKQVIFNPNGSVYTPNYSSTPNVLTPQLYIAGTPNDIASSSASTKWYYQTNSAGTPTEITASGTDYTLGTGTPKTLTIKNNVLASNNSMNYICEMQYLDTDTGFTVTTKSEYEIVKITNGTNGTNGVNSVLGVLNNDNCTIPTDSAGNNGNFANAVTTMSVFNGATDDSANWSYTATPQAGAGITGSASGSPANRTYTVTAMTADSGYVDIVASRSGYSSITRRFTINKNKAGINSTSYWLTSSNVAIVKDINGNYTPTSITFQAKSQSGSSAPASYTGRYKIYESTDGSAFPLKTTSGDVPSYTHTPTAGIKAVKVELYQAGGTTVLLDDQIINVVSDGATGQDALTTVVWTPDGTTIRNSTGTLTAKADLYKGATTVSSGATYKWYYQDPTSSTAVGGGGDADGGNGWRLMQTIANPASSSLTLNGTTAGGTLPAGTYYVKYTWLTVEGETQASSEQNIVMVANNQLKITIPAFPSGVNGAKVYVGTATGVNKYQNTISTSAGTLTISAPINTTNPAPPGTNTATVDNWGVTGFTTDTITIPASSIASVESFKCITTYNSNKYAGAVTVTDLTDPIMVTIVGIDTFKNGTGVTSLTAKLYQAGLELDPLGNQGYTYTWYLYDNNNVKMTNVVGWGGASSKTGKTVPVDGVDVTIRGNIVCEVSK